MKNKFNIQMITPKKNQAIFAITIALFSTIMMVTSCDMSYATPANTYVIQPDSSTLTLPSGPNPSVINTISVSAKDSNGIAISNAAILVNLVTPGGGTIIPLQGNTDTNGNADIDTPPLTIPGQYNAEVTLRGHPAISVPYTESISWNVERDTNPADFDVTFKIRTSPVTVPGTNEATVLVESTTTGTPADDFDVNWKVSSRDGIQQQISEITGMDGPGRSTINFPVDVRGAWTVNVEVINKAGNMVFEGEKRFSAG